MTNENVPSGKQPLPDWYMERDMVAVYRKIVAGEFCEILGVGSAGKSNFVRHMTKFRVKQRYLHQLAPYFITVMLNPHLMVNIDDEATLQQTGRAWPGYEIMLSRLRRELNDLDRRQLLPHSADSKDVIEEVFMRIRNLFHKQPVIAHSGIRHLEDAVYEVLAMGPQWHLVFIFDEIEEFVRTLPPEFFQSLRGLRDEFKGRVMYVTTARVPLIDLAKQKIEKSADPDTTMVMQGFTELFTGFTHYLQPLDENSAREAIRRLEERNQFTMHENNRKRLLRATGHHAGLLRRGFMPTMNFSVEARAESEYFPRLLSDRGVTRECDMIYTSLAADEQAILMAITQRQPPKQVTPALQALIDKHLIVDMNGEYVHRLPILAGYLMDLARRGR